MSSRETTGAVVDNILKLVVGTGMLATALVAPNALQVFDKPVQKYLKTLDKRSRERELSRIMAYMKNRELIADNYKHGLQITNKGKKRLQKLDFDTIFIIQPKQWDQKWRIVFFDIPEEHKTERNALNFKLRSLGFLPLQKSAWIYPFHCQDEINLICETYNISKYVTYIETSYIANQKALQKRFPYLH